MVNIFLHIYCCIFENRKRKTKICGVQFNGCSGHYAEQQGVLIYYHSQ